MTQRIIDILEFVQIHEKYGKTVKFRLLLPAYANLLGKMPTIWQKGKRIEVCQLANFLFRIYPFTNIFQNQYAGTLCHWIETHLQGQPVQTGINKPLFTAAIYAIQQPVSKCCMAHRNSICSQ